MTKVRSVQLSAFPDIQPDKPVGPILPSVFVGTNADLMAAVAPFYLTGSVCDLTYGEGKWWDRFRPDQFVGHDKFKGDGVDFTDLPEPDNTYDAVCYDPPYVLSGGKSSAALNGQDFQGRYGIGQDRLGHNGFRAFEALVGAGLSEVEFGLRLRREVVREFAPYLGVNWTWKLGQSAAYARAAGDSVAERSVVAGVRFWF